MLTVKYAWRSLRVKQFLFSVVENWTASAWCK